MAKKFMGFKPETMTNKILPALGYNGPSDQKSINAFLAASPAAAAKMGKYTMAARQMVEGKPIQANKGMNAIQTFHSLPQSQKTAAAHQAAIRKFSRSIGSQRGGGGSRQQASPVIRPVSVNNAVGFPGSGGIPAAGATTINPDGSVTPGSTPVGTGGTASEFEDSEKETISGVSLMFTALY